MSAWKTGAWRAGAWRGTAWADDDGEATIGRAIRIDRGARAGRESLYGVTDRTARRGSDQTHGPRRDQTARRRSDQG